MDREVSLTGSHIRPQPGYGYDERRHVTVWGRALPGGGDRLEFAPSSAWGWDEAEVPFFEYSERSVGKSRRYFDALSRERGTPVKPRLSLPFLVLRTTRLPFLSATIVPVVLGIVIAASHGAFDLARGDPHDHRGMLRPARDQREQRHLRHGPGRRRRQCHADPVQWRLARHPVRARIVPPDVDARRWLLARRGAGRAAAARAARVAGPARDRHHRVRRRDRLHRATAQARVPRARGGGRRPRVRAADAARGVRRADRGRAVVGAVRRVHPGRPARCPDPLRERDPRPAR